VILLIILFFGYRYWQHASTHEDTDDAYTTGNTHQISPRVTGTVEEVLVDDNWHVHAGQLLVKLDPRDYEVALNRNRAQLKRAPLERQEGHFRQVGPGQDRELKETQLERVQVGQPVEIKIDALPHHQFAGRVDSLQAGAKA
jgi:membrane fusion protein, multidrug efflux system